MWRLIVAAHVMRLFLQQRMDNWTVQALGIILDNELPVGPQMIDTPLHHLEFFHSPRTKFLIEPREVFGEGNWPVRKIDEDVAIPNRGSHSIPRIVGLAKALDFLHVRSGGRSAIEPGGPAVIAALDAPADSARLLLA